MGTIAKNPMALGTEDGNEWAREATDSELKSEALKRHPEAASEGLINALGASKAAAYLGVSLDQHGSWTDAGVEAIREYDRAHRDAVYQSAQERGLV